LIFIAFIFAFLFSRPMGGDGLTKSPRLTGNRGLLKTDLLFRMIAPRCQKAGRNAADGTVVRRPAWRYA
jgi:hypothetical protein